MKVSNIWYLLTALTIVVAAVGVCIADRVATFVACGVGLFTLAMAYRSAVLPMRTIRSGMNLLRSQDFSSRLRRVGQSEADQMVELYNSIMSHMKAERLKNHEQKEFLSKILDASPMGIAICDFDGNIESHNPSFAALATPHVIKVLCELPEEGNRVLRLDGGQVLRCSRLYFMDRGFKRTFYLLERLTDEILKAESAMFCKIVRTMGHEVNNTLGGVISILETMAAIHAGEADVVSALESCKVSCLNLGAFVKGYADVVKLPEAVLEPVSLAGFVEETVPFLRQMCAGNICIVADIADDAGNVAADRMLLQRVLVNAVRNAVESIGQRPGTITVRAARGTLEVVDDGPGISPENSLNLFTPFFSTKHPDRGLGLMLISDILRKHGAAFTLATTTADHLTRLTIRFRN